uniref:8-hydroxygeraniol dehydrogenase-like n=1 Tax=Nicotiana tabacum TaxID=4097 RepID=A0A1S3Y6I5_TOBAC|nr:PREDICTED: 8-hydroxygeraniol dehydrogenase-like [Nicotiana tabacum]
MEKSLEEVHPVKAFGWAAKDTSGLLSPFKFSRRETGDKDVKLKILYCGICHTDLHQVKNEWGFSQYPMVPGYGVNFRFLKVLYFMHMQNSYYLMIFTTYCTFITLLLTYGTTKYFNLARNWK